MEVRTYAMLVKLYLTLHTYQVTMPSLNSPSQASAPAQ